MSRRILVFLLLCLLATAAACGIREKSPVPWQGESAEDLREQIYYQDEAVADIRIGVLQFSGAEPAQQVNEQLFALWRQRLAEYKQEAQKTVDDINFNGGLIPGQICYTREEKAAVFYNDGSLLSLIVEGYQHMQGAAHPFTYRYACNFNAITGQMLSLEDIWGEGAWERAAAEILGQIAGEGRLGDFYQSLEDNLLLYADKSNWYMDDTNVYIIYNPYDIAPYALGIVEFALPKESISLSPEV